MQEIDKGYLIAATRSNNGYNSNIFLLAIGEGGDSLWSKEYDMGAYEYVGGMEHSSDGNLIITGDWHSPYQFYEIFLI